MAYIAPTSRSDGYVVPASVWNSDVVSNPIALAKAVSMLCNGRLTLTTAVPVTTSDVTAATTIYFTPYNGNLVGVYTGSTWIPHTLTELSIAVPATTDTNYDVFLDYNAGSPVLAVTAWTNSSTRATALTTQDGIYVQTGNTDWRYLGSFRTTGVSGQTEDSVANRLLWNNYNRVPRVLQAYESTANWNYSTATVRQARATATNQVAVVVGVAEVPISLSLRVIAANSSGAVGLTFGIGEDATTTYAAGGYLGPATNIITPASTQLTKFPAVGYHYYSWNEWSTATGTTTWYSNVASSGSTIQSGLTGSVMG